MSRTTLGPLAAGALLSAAIASPAWSAIAYTPVALPPGAVPAIGPGIAAPTTVFGKEYSHERDLSPTSGADAQRMTAWDGLGGTLDGVDFTGTRPTYTPDDQVDASANHQDALFNPLRRDQAHLVFSHDDRISVYDTPGTFRPAMVPSAGPVFLSGGQVIGGAGELSSEAAGFYAPPATMTVWAKQAEVNGMPLPSDVDGVELWGPEPGESGDTDKYSLDVDSFSRPATGAPGTSIWNLSGTPYVSQAAIVAAVTAVLGPMPPSAVLPYPDFIDGQDAINLDALMVHDTLGDTDSFDRSPDGAPGDQIIFSIRQIPDRADPDGYYATGSELFVLDASTGALGASYLRHGGHEWSHAFALSDLVISPNQTDGAYGVIDINAIEAIGELTVPEPTTVLLTVLGVAGAACGRRRR